MYNLKGERAAAQPEREQKKKKESPQAVEAQLAAAPGGEEPTLKTVSTKRTFSQLIYLVTEAGNFCPTSSLRLNPRFVHRSVA